MRKIELMATWWEIQAKMLYELISHQMKVLERDYPGSKTSVIIQPFTEHKVAMWLLVASKEQIHVASCHQILKQARNENEMSRYFCFKKTYTICCQMMPVMEILEEMMESANCRKAITTYVDLQMVRDFLVDAKSVSKYNFVWEFC